MRKSIRIYDNGGGTADRYTAIDMNRPTGDPGLFDAIGFDEDPYHPQGFGQHTSAMPGEHLGKRISLIELPEPAQKFVEQFEKEGES